MSSSTATKRTTPQEEPLPQTLEEAFEKVDKKI